MGLPVAKKTAVQTGTGVTIAAAAMLAVGAIASSLGIGLFAVLPVARLQLVHIAGAAGDDIDEDPPVGNFGYAQYFGTDGAAILSFQQTQDYGYLSVGWARQPGRTDQDVYVVRGSALDPKLPGLEGYQEWAKFFGGTGNDIGNAVVESVDANGSANGYVLAGTWTESAGKASQAMLMKITPTGNLDPAWSPNPKLFAFADGDQVAYGLDQTFDADGKPNGYVVAGKRQYTNTDGVFVSDIVAIKLDSQGKLDPAWPENPKIIRPGLLNTASSIQQTFSSRVTPRQPTGFILTGTTSNEPGGNDVLLAHLDTAGNLAAAWGGNVKIFDWARVDVGNAVRQTFDAAGRPTGYVAAGRTSSNVVDAFLLKTDQAGNLDPDWPINPQRYGAEDADSANDVRQTFDTAGNPSGFILAGETHSPSLHLQGLADMYVVRAGLRGREVWHLLTLGSGFDVGYAVRPLSGNTSHGYAVAGQTATFTGPNESSNGWMVFFHAGRTGVIQKFRRGDADGSEEIDLTDAVFALSGMFLGGPQPACLDAADTDDTGQWDISDVVYDLNYMFLSGAPPPDPGPEIPGPDPTDDALSCVSYPQD
ncbi:MAG: hypothetical protein Q7S23_02475 [bacterium]|nr:hypothetical protein [bacterium]